MNHRSIRFQTIFGLNQDLVDELKHRPEHIVFSERSRIARLGIQIKCDPPDADSLEGNMISLTLVASAVIPGYPGLDEFKDFFTLGLPVGRLVFCDPEALLSSDEVLAAIERAELKLPENSRVICLYRADRLLVPEESTRLKAGDEVVVITDYERLDELKTLFRNDEE